MILPVIPAIFIVIPMIFLSFPHFLLVIPAEAGIQCYYVIPMKTGINII